MSTSAENVTLDQARARADQLLQQAGCSATAAQSVASALVNAERDGQRGHGLSRLAAYIAQVRCGKINGQADVQCRQNKPGLIDIDAGCGFAFPAFDHAISALQDSARSQGIACARISRSHHAGALGLVVERLADAGFIAMMVANSPAAMAPWGGHKALYGTNPIAFAAPRDNAPALVIDLSLSRVARGKVMYAAQRDQDIPNDWALDAQGQPTSNAQEALAGTMLPAGEAKGAALALMVEVLAAALCGAHFSFQASSFLNAEGPPPEVGQCIIAIDPGAGFSARINTLIAEIEEQARLPGVRRLTARAQAQTTGVEFPAID